MPGTAWLLKNRIRTDRVYYLIQKILWFFSKSPKGKPLNTRLLAFPREFGDKYGGPYRLLDWFIALRGSHLIYAFFRVEFILFEVTLHSIYLALFLSRTRFYYFLHDNLDFIAFSFIKICKIEKNLNQRLFLVCGPFKNEIWIET